MAKKGIYLQKLDLKLPDETTMDNHVIVELFEPNDKGFCAEPVIRHAYLQKGVLAEFPLGTPVSFNYGVKQKTRKDGSRFEQIVPEDIQPLRVK